MSIELFLVIIVTYHNRVVYNNYIYMTIPELLFYCIVSIVLSIIKLSIIKLFSDLGKLIILNLLISVYFRFKFWPQYRTTHMLQDSGVDMIYHIL